MPKSKKTYSQMSLRELLEELCPDCFDPDKVSAVEDEITKRAREDAAHNVLFNATSGL